MWKLKMIENPFRYGQVVTGEYFTNREDEIKELSEEIISGQSVILISPRRYGKTSLVVNTINKIKYPSVNIDLQLIADEVDLANVLIKKLFSLSRFEKIKHFLKNLRIQPAIQYDPKSNELSIVFNPGEKNIAIYLEDALEISQHIAKSQRRKIIVIFDEFQEVRRISRNLEKKMRAIFQHHKDVSYVFIGSQEHMIRDIFENINNPFYKFGKQILLHEMKTDKLKKFINERFATTGVDASSVVDTIIDITHNHPYYIQQLCHEIFIINDQKVIHQNSIEKAISNILSNHNFAYQKWWGQLDNTERKILIGICNDMQKPTSSEFISAFSIKSTSTAGSAVKRLIEKGILIKRNGELYRIEDPFWMRWIIFSRK
jgi:AAA+ ATPase superfamily predicted ATPase